jgi:hypothetical protein
LLLEPGLGALLLESDFGELLLESDLGALVLDDGELESSPFFAEIPARFEGPEYKSDSQPPPLRMKLPPPIMRRASSLPHFGHFLRGFSVMRCSRSNS